MHLIVYTAIDGGAGIPVPPAALAAAGDIPAHLQQCHVLIPATDAADALEMLERRGIRLSPKAFIAEAEVTPEARALRAAGLIDSPPDMVYLLIWDGTGNTVVQVFTDGTMQRIGRLSHVVDQDILAFEADQGEPVGSESNPGVAVPADTISVSVVRYLAERLGRKVSRDLNSVALDVRAAAERDRLPTSGELMGIASTLMQIATERRAMEDLAQLLPKQGR